MVPVIIAGGGPAGASCAWSLASAGVPCVVLDGAVFPREKVCGGALSFRGSHLLIESGMLSGDELDLLTVARHTGISFWDGGRLLATWNGPGPAVRLVDRTAFDAYLIGTAASAGAVIREGTAVASVDAGSSTVTLSTGERLSYAVLVGADGASSVVRRRLFPPRRRRGSTGLGLEVFVPRGELDPVPGELQIRFGILPYGYGWVFPGADSVCIGAGVTGSRAAAPRVRSALRDLLRDLGLEPDAFRLHGARIPSLALHGQLGGGDVYLAGDAAGLCDQVSGEGISHAIASGMLVAEAIRGGWSRRRLAVEARRGCAGLVRQSARFRHLLYAPLLRGEAMKRLGRNPRFAEAYWEMISGRTDYVGMFRRVLRGS